MVTRSAPAIVRGDRPPRFTLQTQRGCPLACDFCGASRLLGPFQEKPIAAIPGVESVTPVLKPYKLVAREFRGGNPSQVRIGDELQQVLITGEIFREQAKMEN